MNRVQVRTVVLGLLLGLVTVVSLAAEVADVSVDLGAVLVIALLGSGVLLLLGAWRAVRARPGPGRP